jgi:hypothetical protein
MIVTQQNPTVILARVIDSTGSLITKTEILWITIDVFNAESGEQTLAQTIPVVDCVFDTLQTDARWTTDSIGYNIAVPVDASALPDGDIVYQMQVTLCPLAGERFRIVSRVKTKPVFMSMYGS